MLDNPELKKENYFAHQWDFLKKTGNPSARVTALVGGFGCGKTKVGLAKVLISLIHIILHNINLKHCMVI